PLRRSPEGCVRRLGQGGLDEHRAGQSGHRCRRHGEDVPGLPVPDRAGHPADHHTRRLAPASGGTSLRRTVDIAMRTVLGRQVRPDDPKGFLATLTASFALSDFEGHRVWTYTPRSFAGAAEFGESLTGLQASLVKRGTNALDQTLPLIDSVKTL